MSYLFCSSWFFLRKSCIEIWGIPSGSVVKNLPANTWDAGDASWIPGSGRSPGGGNGNLLQYSCLKNPMDREPGGLQGCKESDMTERAHCLLLVKQSCGLVLIISPISVLSTAGREKYPFYSALWHQSESPWEPAALQWPFQSLCSPGEADSRAASCEWEGEGLGKVLGNWARMIKHKAQRRKGWCLQAED